MKRNEPVRLKLGLEKVKAHAVSLVDEHFNRLAHANLHIDHEYSEKRHEARRHLSGEHSSHIEREAQARAVSADDLAAVIAAKPNTILDRAHERRGHVANIEAARTLADIERVLSGLGLKLTSDRASAF